MVKTGPVNVDVTGVNFAWHNGYELVGFRIEPISADGQAPFLECSRLWVRPSVESLVRGNPYDLLFSADLYGGQAQGEVTLKAGSLLGNLELRNLRLSRYRALAALIDEGQLEGRVSGQATFESKVGNPNAGQIAGELTLDGMSLVGAKVQGFAVPDIHFRQTKLKFTLHGSRMEIQEFTAAGDVGVQGSGTIVLREPILDSVLNLHATLETSLETPDGAKTLVGLIPRTPGAKPDAPLTITGTLGRPKTR
jgi:type II secretion system protein N